MTDGDRALTPDDAVVALRSFPRRFRVAVARPDDADERFDPDDAARRPGPDGTTVAEHLCAALALVRAVGDAARSGTVSPLPTTVSDDGRPLGSLLDDLESSASAAADAIDAVPAAGWTEPGRLDLVQDGVAATASRLRTAQATLRAVS